jgi:hypothetical protein
MKNLILLISTAVVLCGCGSLTKTATPIKQYPSNQMGAIDVIGNNQLTSDNVLIGSVSVTDQTGGMLSKKKCTHDIVLNEALTLARSMGGQLLVITELKEPYSSYSTGFGFTPNGTMGTVINGTSSGCYQIKADVYRIEK